MTANPFQQVVDLSKGQSKQTTDAQTQAHRQTQSDPPTDANTLPSMFGPIPQRDAYTTHEHVVRAPNDSAGFFSAYDPTQSSHARTDPHLQAVTPESPFIWSQTSNSGRSYNDQTMTRSLEYY